MNPTVPTARLIAKYLAREEHMAHVVPPTSERRRRGLCVSLTIRCRYD